ncbi:PD-(D/E)XK nuclease family protein [Hyunsoonleella aestuarii]|uniref:PD-(D/E)XK nuclease family protein n=1 Tax=Hyunsoonleella aestuarii TaxID=912802 RepID=A0ABP8EA24_9FLAO|nr:PD-(D/E)XK nuclease family protein [Hyunsoonleella aestuarii]
MTTFIFDVLKDLKEINVDLSKTTFILPSKRAGVFLKYHLPQFINAPIFSPSILSIEEFIGDMSELESISNAELLFEFYTSYIKLSEKKAIESFESFSKWAQILLQDFNEIDRHLIPQEQIFNYLSDIQDLKHWSLEGNKTDFVRNYLAFWNKLYDYYNHFTKHLLNINKGYQGLIYREAVVNLESYIKDNSHKLHVFLGFNALNTAEEFIIQELLQNSSAKIYWDIDKVFIDNSKHDAALFTRRYKNSWGYFKKNAFNWVTNNYSDKKSISICGIPKSVGQAKHIGSIINDLMRERGSLEKTAVVLGDENLLIPILNSLPLSIESLNITMGFPLKSTPLTSLFDALFLLHKNGSHLFYHKDIIKIISHQFVRPLLVEEHHDYASKLIEAINENNYIYLNITQLKEITPNRNGIIDLLFTDWSNSIENILKKCSQLILTIKENLDRDKRSNLLSLEYLYRFNSMFNELSRLNSEYNHIGDISSLYSLYKELLSVETLDFQGEPLEGLQIMGMLESRVIDFETVIISSVNEGVLPSGKSNNSFIPFDVKLENNLPTYKEKDAVYTYHFYRLLQRAKNIYILYNTEADVLTGGEKSRFITQLEIENIHQIKQQIVTPKTPSTSSQLTTVIKTEALEKLIIDIVKSGLSPSSLTNYIRNPIDFYYQKVLKIKEYDDVEETIAANTLGTVVHNTLEDFYKPLEGEFLMIESLKKLKSQIDKKVAFHFKKEYKKGDITKGKNLIVFEIAKRYVSNFLDFEIRELDAGNSIKIIAIEANHNISIDVPRLNFPVWLTGKIDRIDSYNGVTRIIDYKTGSVNQNQVELADWEVISTDYKKYGKSFQVLFYTYLLKKTNSIQLPVEAGIVSFNNLGSGFLKFGKKESPFSRAKNTLITNDTLLSFENELIKLIKEICNPDIPFTEKKL